MKNIISDIKKNMKYIKLKDLLDILIFLCILPISIVYIIYLKIIKKEIWVICEEKDEACDNGYHLFKYIRTEHPEVNVYYAINKKANDYKKVTKYGNVIQYGGFRHWIYYLVASKNISSQKAGNPSAPLFYFLQVYGILRNKRIFLQHGIILNDTKYLYYKHTKFKLFIAGARPEYEYIKEKFGYPEGIVVYAGLCRHDNLHNVKVNKKKILLMPTWRSWLGRTKNIFTEKEKFENTEYCKRYISLINNEKIIKYIEEKNLELYFYPHRHMQKFISSFSSKSNNVKIVSGVEKDIQELLKESALMITDYSSVSIDFAYMEKPIIYYQFDKQEFRDRHLSESYFSYENDGFGRIADQEEELSKIIIEYIENEYKIEDVYKNRMKNFFELHDQKNCERNYSAIKNI